MYECECGRTFSRQCDLSKHSKYCIGIQYCNNPECNNILSGYQKKFCSSKCSSIVNSPGREHSKETKIKISKSLGGKGTCRDNYNNENKKCKYCEKILKRPDQKFCNLHCQHEYNYVTYIKRWKEGKETGSIKNGPSGYVRRYILEKYNFSCQKCNWTIGIRKNGACPIHIHHMDGDRLNNKENNLEALCPNCHILTETFGGRNIYKTYYFDNKKRELRIIGDKYV